MSYVSLYPKDWRQGNYLALNGTAEAALFRTLEEYPEVRGVVLVLDNDAGGIEGVMRLTGRCGKKDTRMFLYSFRHGRIGTRN